MDCTIFLWESGDAPGPPSGEARRADLRRHLRLVYPVPADRPFGDLVQALSRPHPVR